MSDTTAIILVVVVVVLAAALVGFLLTRTRGRERRTRQADELRTQAAAQTTDVDRAAQVAASREAVAEEAREEAERTEAHAAEARHDLAQAEAAQEDTVREADKVDPAVDTRKDDYAPDDVRAPRHRT